jgi:hypothetical protein
MYLLWNQFRVKAVAGQLGERNLVWFGTAAAHVAERNNSQAGVRVRPLCTDFPAKILTETTIGLKQTI